uniref:Uncharacterized protein n=1 Tax=Zea mays TaxID=4577 RepID=A0A804QQS3_MAIZE
MEATVVVAAAVEAEEEEAAAAAASTPQRSGRKRPRAIGSGRYRSVSSQQAGSRPGTDGRRRRMEAAATSQPHRRPRTQEKEAVFAWTGIADLTAD